MYLQRHLVAWKTYLLKFHTALQERVQPLEPRNRIPQFPMSCAIKKEGEKKLLMSHHAGLLSLFSEHLLALPPSQSFAGRCVYDLGSGLRSNDKSVLESARVETQAENRHNRSRGGSGGGGWSTTHPVILTECVPCLRYCGGLVKLASVCL